MAGERGSDGAGAMRAMAGEITTSASASTNAVELTAPQAGMYSADAWPEVPPVPVARSYHQRLCVIECI